MTEMITITFGDAGTLELKVYEGTTNIDYIFEGLTIDRQPNKVGITTDPNYNYRRVSCKAYITAAEIVDTLDGKLLPAAAPTYDGTDPKILVNLSGAKSITMLCAITACRVSHITDDKWSASFTFEGRTL